MEEENFVPDYDDFLEESDPPPRTAAKSKKSKKSVCSICSRAVRIHRRHVIQCHLPVQFNPDYITCNDCSSIIVESLLRLAFQFGLFSIDALFWFFLENSWSNPSFIDCSITDNDIRLFDTLSLALQIHPVKYQLHPPNSPAVLCHWRILSTLLTKLPSSRFQSEFRFCSINNLCPNAEDVISDSHFHLDQTLSRSKVSCFSDLVFDSSFPIALAINNCCFSRIPSLNEIHSIHDSDNRIFFSIGAHPRFVHSPPPSLISKVSSLVSSPVVVGIGELGLDYTASSRDHRESQASFIVPLLKLAIAHSKVIVIHCRDKENETHAFHDLLGLLQSHVPKFHPIHFHCFTYSTSLMYRWIGSFPNTCFGVTSILFKSFTQHAHLLQSIDLHRIVLESDSPYLAKSSASLLPIATKFASLRCMPLSHFNTLIYQNTTRLYNISQ